MTDASTFGESPFARVARFDPEAVTFSCTFCDAVVLEHTRIVTNVAFVLLVGDRCRWVHMLDGNILHECPPGDDILTHLDTTTQWDLPSSTA